MSKFSLSALSFLFSFVFSSPTVEAQSLERALFRVIYRGDLDSVKILIGLGANVNAKANGSDATPLHVAADYDQYDIARFLIESGADVSAQKRCFDRRPGGLKKGLTPLHYAIRKTVFLNRMHPPGPNLPLIGLLLRSGADIRAWDCNGNTALRTFFKFDKQDSNLAEILDTLIACGANLAAESYWLMQVDGSDHGVSYTLLHYASRWGNLAAVKMLVDYGLPVNAMQHGEHLAGETALDLALRHSHHEVTVFLKKVGGRTRKELEGR